MAERPDFRAPKGTQDILPPESARWEALLATFARVADLHGYGLIQSPMFEDLAVFQRIGEGTDVVSKEMYDFEDKGGRRVALRPEGTAPVARAFVEHRPDVPWKVWYATPAFRYERPQAGRYRQHHQVGVECIGSADADADVEVIALGHAYLSELGLRQWRLLLNFMGTPADRVAYAAVLQDWLRGRADELAADDAEKIESHPMRVLDSKRPKTRAALEGAPRMADHLDAASKAHAERVQAGLDLLGIDYELDETLVRGLDYYTHTVFEFQSTSLDSAQLTILAGGRYDGLIEQLGGAPTPGIGFGSGIERLLIALEAQGVELPRSTKPLVWLISIGDAARDANWKLLRELRAAGITADTDASGRSPKAQFKIADREKARFAITVGDDELKNNQVTVKDFTTAEQTTISRDGVIDHLKSLGA